MIVVNGADASAGSLFHCESTTGCRVASQFCPAVGMLLRL
jgi:hypothetical protein